MSALEMRKVFLFSYEKDLGLLVLMVIFDRTSNSTCVVKT